MRKMMLGNEAVARGAYEAGVSFGSGYPGTPSTEILEYFSKYDGPVIQWAPNEKVGYEVCIGASLAGVRSLVTMKHVGLNVAADPFFSSSYMGVNGGLVVVSADDPGMHSSQDEQDNRWLARAAKVIMVEPTDPEECRWMTRGAFELSEQFDSPVLLRMTTRVCHQTGIVEEMAPEERINKGYKKQIQKNVLLPGNARVRRHDVEERLRKAEAFGNGSDRWNPIIKGSSDVGVITSGISFGYVREAMPDASILKLGISFPLPMDRIRRFAEGVKTLFVVEELEPFMEEQIRAAGIPTEGRGRFSYTGELNLSIVENALKGNSTFSPSVSLDGVELPKRPPTLCPGCAHRAVFTALRDMHVRVMGDIGCYTLGAVKPLASMESCLCMGASIGMAEGLDRFGGAKEKNNTIAAIGDSTFFHSGITGLVDMLYNGSHATVMILDNRTTAMTGGQPHPGSGKDINGKKARRLFIPAICWGLGIQRVVQINPYDIEAFKRTVKEELEADELSVIIVEAPCILNKEVSPLDPVEVDLEACNKCGACIRVGCIGIYEQDGYPKVNDSLCIGCMVCGQVCEPHAIHHVRRT